MKNNRFAAIGMICFTLVFITALSGCQDVPYEGNTEEKVLVITGAAGFNGVTSSTPRIEGCWLWERVGTGIAKASSSIPLFITGTTVRFDLFQALTAYRWRGNGGHYIRVEVDLRDGSEADYWYTGGGTTRTKVDFNKKTIELPWSHFRQF
ncbi:MAG: hypothetical protein LBQ69_06520 [Treponema sp.]|nr:hypothetical protein [Treponema sp.]